VTALRRRDVMRGRRLTGLELLVRFRARGLARAARSEDEELESVHTDLRGTGDEGDRQQRRGGGRGDFHGLELPGLLLRLLLRSCRRPGPWLGVRFRGPGARLGLGPRRPGSWLGFRSRWPGAGRS